MKNYNICVLGYNKNFKKFLNHIKKKTTNYNFKFKINNLNRNFDYLDFKQNILEKKIKFIAICNLRFLRLVTEDIEFYIKKKIKIVKASTNKEIQIHGFIIEKPFSDFSFEQLFLRKKLRNNYKNNSIVKNKTVLITGGAGSIGSGIVKNLLSQKPKLIVILDNNEYNIFKLNESLNKSNKFQKNIVFSLTNIENKVFVDEEFKKYKPDIVFHAAALKHVIFLENNVKQGILTNVFGTKNILESSKKYKIKYFIHISTDKAADPKNILGFTKKISEYICQTYKKNLKIGIVRFGNVFNSYGSATEKFKNKINNSEKIYLSDPDVERYFMSNAEASNLIMLTLNHLKTSNNKGCKTFIFKMDKPIKIKDLVIKMIYLSGRNPNKILSSKYYGLNDIEKMSEKLIDTSDVITNSYNDKIIQVETKPQNINLSYLRKIIISNFNNIKIKQKLSNLFNM